MHPVPTLLLQRLVGLLLHDSLSDLRDARRFNEVGKLEGRLLNTTLSGHVLPLAVPMFRDVDRVPVRLQIHQEPWVSRRGIPDFDNIRPPHQGLQFSDRHACLDLPLLLRHLPASLLVLILAVLLNLHARVAGFRRGRPRGSSGPATLLVRQLLNGAAGRCIHSPRLRRLLRWRAAQVPPSHAEIAVDLRVPRRLGQGQLKVLHRFLVTPQLVQGLALPVECLHVPVVQG
mmetsp:Transcript_123538/g.275854  ORF Transcript_123538/g.275854 Transcript_123538/m.275854 type:complete len:230 (+) Transcript_123538:1571-2260(+)